MKKAKHPRSHPLATVRLIKNPHPPPTPHPRPNRSDKSAVRYAFTRPNTTSSPFVNHPSPVALLKLNHRRTRQFLVACKRSQRLVTTSRDDRTRGVKTHIKINCIYPPSLPTRTDPLTPDTTRLSRVPVPLLRIRPPKFSRNPRNRRLKLRSSTEISEPTLVRALNREVL